ncbi:CHC2 zinc finger domain-containing protein [Priestia megaterium]|uniref:CHC2 zinc finger domain-containing protein n=1 Tax=Priestia megaterium TaxID=1404 RepID=UPI00345A564F
MWIKSYKEYKSLKPMELIQLVKDSIRLEVGFDYYAGISLKNVRGRHTKLITCIFHQDKTPSLAIKPSKNVFYCFGCQAKGDIVTLVSLLNNVSQFKAAYIIAEDFGLLDGVGTQIIQTLKEKTIDKKLEINFRKREVESFDFLLKVKKHFQSITKNIKNERDIQRKGELYHIITKIEYYLDLLSEYEKYSPEERVDNYILIQKFIGKEIYPIYQAVLDKLIGGEHNWVKLGEQY